MPHGYGERPSLVTQRQREAYVNRNANTLSREQLTGKIKSLMEGKASSSVLTNMTKTFLELVKLANFSASAGEKTSESPQPDPNEPDTSPAIDPDGGPSAIARETRLEPAGGGPTLVYRIEIVLPAVRDQAIYDAIFRSAKEHLLR